MISVGACPICGTPRPAERMSAEPWCCSLACYRAFHGIDQPEASSSQEGVTTTCPVCQRQFTPVGRRAYCSEACRVAAYRRRRDAERPPVVLPTATPRRPITVYECDGCGVRAVGEQRCPDCTTFMRRIGIGGCCPRCNDPVAVTELLGEEVIAGR
jgi:life-span regulatory factor Ecl1